MAAHQFRRPEGPQRSKSDRKRSLHIGSRSCSELSLALPLIGPKFVRLR